MTRGLRIVAALALFAPPALAAEEAAGSGFLVRQIEFGVSTAETDTNSSRFREYRALPNGFVVSSFRFAGNDKFWYDLTGKNLLQDDAHYGLIAQPWSIKIEADYQKIPHRFGNDARSLLNETAPGVLSISDTLQRAFQGSLETLYANPATRAQIAFPFLSGLVTPSLLAAGSFDLRLLRERGRLTLDLTPDKPLDVKLSYFQEKRRGTRASGTSFGFGNVVESPEPIDYTTRDLLASAEWTRSWGLVRGSVRYNQFDNHIETQSFDNPFRAVSATDPSAYTAPGAGSIGGPSFGRVSLPPDNKAVTGSLGFLVKFKKSSRLSTDVSLGQWTQNDPFMPATTNAAIATPALPASSLDGKIDVLSINSTFTSKPVSKLFVRAGYRYYDLDNKSPRISFPSYVRFDAAFEAIPRISVPYGNKNVQANLTAAYDFGPATFEAGVKRDAWDRTFRETEKTTQTTGYGKLDVRASDWAVLRASYEKGSRSFAGLELERSEDASLQRPGAPANILAVPSGLCPAGVVCNLRFDQSKKDIERWGGHLELQPGGEATITLSYLDGKDDYSQSRFGLVNARSKTFSADAGWAPGARVDLYGYYNHEKVGSFQRGRQSAATVSLNALDDWTSDIQDTVDSVGAGGTFALVKEKLDARLDASFQRVDGNNDLTAGGTVRPTGAVDIPLFDDTKLWTAAAELQWKLARFVLGFGGWYESYRLRDSNTSGLTNYVPGSFFLAPDDSDYQAHVLYVRATYAW